MKSLNMIRLNRIYFYLQNLLIIINKIMLILDDNYQTILTLNLLLFIKYQLPIFIYLILN